MLHPDSNRADEHVTGFLPQKRRPALGSLSAAPSSGALIVLALIVAALTGRIMESAAADGDVLRDSEAR